MVCAEGMYTGQFIYCGKKGKRNECWLDGGILIGCFSLAGLTIGNVMPLGQMPEGTIICQIEQKTGDRGKLAKASGKCLNDDENFSKLLFRLLIHFWCFKAFWVQHNIHIAFLVFFFLFKVIMQPLFHIIPKLAKPKLNYHQVLKKLFHQAIEPWLVSINRKISSCTYIC